MQPQSVSDLIKHAEWQRFDLVTGLKRLGAEAKAAILFLVNLLELQETREQRLAQLRLKLPCRSQLELFRRRNSTQRSITRRPKF
jgi:hypothetical protein